MQVTRLHDEVEEAVSGTFETSPRNRFDEAHSLACEIERLLTPADGETANEPYSARLTRALARSLIDALVDMKRDNARARKLA